MCLAAVEGWIEVDQGEKCRQRKGLFISMLVGGRAVNKNNQLSEAVEGGRRWWRRRRRKRVKNCCLLLHHKQGEPKWLCTVGEKMSDNELCQ